MTTTTTTEARLYHAVTALIPLLEAKIAEIEAHSDSHGSRRGGPTDAAAINLTNLETLLVRLQQIKTWLEEGDPAFTTVLRQHITDDNTRNQRRESRRDWTIAIATTIVGVLLGWLSSLAATPATLWHLLVR